MIVFDLVDGDGVGVGIVQGLFWIDKVGVFVFVFVYENVCECGELVVFDDW